MPISSVLGSSALLPAGLGLRNAIINGDFSIDQRNNGSNQVINFSFPLAYTVDRWYAYCTGSNINAQRVAGTAPYQFNYRFSSSSNNNSLIGFGQRIEAANSNHFAGRTASLSADIACSSSLVVRWTLFYANTTDSFGTVASPTRTQIATGTFATIPTMSRFQAQIAVPSAATTGLELLFTVGSGTTGSGLTNGNTLTFAGVQLEANSQATPFEQLPVGLELFLCQRYYERITGVGSVNTDWANIGSGGWDSSTTFSCTYIYRVPKRVRPSVFSSGTGINCLYHGVAWQAVTSVNSYTEISTIAVRINYVCSGTSVQGQAGIAVLASASAYIEASAEL